MPSPVLNLKKGVATDADIAREIMLVSADGALAITGSCTVIVTKVSACAMTLAAPATALNGVEVTLISTTAAAHTLTNTTPGFNDAGASGDVATWAAAKGNGMTIVAYGGKWYVKNLVGVTLG